MEKDKEKKNDSDSKKNIEKEKKKNSVSKKSLDKEKQKDNDSKKNIDKEKQKDSVSKKNVNFEKDENNDSEIVVNIEENNSNNNSISDNNSFEGVIPIVENTVNNSEQVMSETEPVQMEPETFNNNYNYNYGNNQQGVQCLGGTFVVKEKKSHKKTFIGILVIMIIALIAVGGYYLHDYLELKEPIEEVWGQTYYVYLKDIKSIDKAKEAGIPENMKDAKLNFYEVDYVDDPIMVLSYTKDNDDYSNVYYIEDGKVNAVVYNDPTDVEFLYNISMKKYDYYVHTTSESSDSYNIVLDNIYKDHTKNECKETECEDTINDILNGYTFTKDEKETVTDVNGEEISIFKFDKTFVKPDIENNSVDYRTDLSEKELKKTVTDLVDNYQLQKEIINEEVEKEVSTKVDSVNKKVEEMETALQEVKIKEAALTSQNLQSKIGTHLKWFKGAYLGVTYGWPSVFTYKDVTGTVNVPGSEDMMLYEVVGLKSIDSLKSQLANYVSKDKFTEFEKYGFVNGFTEYNNKVYWINGGVGDGPFIDTTKAKVISSENGISKVQLQNYNAISGMLDETITLTVEYDEVTEKYLITDWTVKRNY